MSCCCEKILRLCKVSVCGTSQIDFGIVAAIAGTYKIKFDFLGIEYSIEKAFEVDEAIKFPTQELNESHVFLFRLYDPEGNQVSITRDEIIYDCVEVETTISFLLNPA